MKIIIYKIKDSYELLNIWYNLLNIKGIKINDGFLLLEEIPVLSVILAQKISKILILNFIHQIF
ncbi:hypothetical protein AB8Q19_00035 [Candidatus Profftella armatura]